MSARRDALHSVQEVRFACQLSPLVALVANVRPGHVSCMVQAGLRASRVLFFSPGMLACGAPFSPRCTLLAIPLLSQPQPGNLFRFFFHSLAAPRAQATTRAERELKPGWRGWRE